MNTNPPAALANELRDIKPPVEIPNLWLWLWLALAALAALGAAYFVVRRWLKRRNEVPPAPPIPAHVRAKQRLREALALIGEPKPFVILVSDTLRGYLEERFNFHAPDRTTEEFLYELQSTNRLLPDQKESLRDFLQRSDLVKFARYEPGEPELRDLHGSALRLVEETEPVEIPPPPGTPGSQSEIRNPQSAIR